MAGKVQHARCKNAVIFEVLPHEPFRRFLNNRCSATRLIDDVQVFRGQGLKRGTQWRSSLHSEPKEY